VNPSTAAVARSAAVAIVLILAAVLGLVVGNALDSRSGGVPASRTATAAFSLDAIAALQAIRDDPAVAGLDDYLDYGLRHAPTASSDDYPDYGLRHRNAEPEAADTTESVTTPTPR
jgi:hypothetical protein